MDLEIRRLHEELIACLNGYQIPIEVKRYVLKEIYQAVELKANEIVEQEKIAEAEKAKKEDEE